MGATAEVICVALAFAVAAALPGGGKDTKPCPEVITELKKFKNELEKDLSNCKNAIDENTLPLYKELAEIEKIADFTEDTCQLPKDLLKEVKDIIGELTACRYDCAGRFGGSCDKTRAECLAMSFTPQPDGFCSDQPKTCCLFS